MGDSGPWGTIPVCSTTHSFSDLLGCHFDKYQLTVSTDVHTTRSPPNRPGPGRSLNTEQRVRHFPALECQCFCLLCAHHSHSHCAMRWHSAVVSVSGLELGSPLSAWAVCTSDWRPQAEAPLGMERPWEWGCPQKSSDLHQYGRREHQQCLNSARLAHRPGIPTRRGGRRKGEGKEGRGQGPFY